MFNISQIKSNLHKSFQDQCNLTESEIEAEINIILEYYLNITQESILLDPSRLFTETELEPIMNCIKQRMHNIPLVYILGETVFFKYKFAINQHVLIPRPETEILIELIMSIISTNQELDILDICTGSGCIAITLAKELYGNNNIYALDICPNALQLATHNAQQHNIQNIQFIQHDICNNNIADLKLSNNQDNLIISNPPYITPTEYKNLDNDVQLEPYVALVGNNSNTDGLQYYQSLYNNYIDKNTQYIALELDPSRAESIYNIFAQQFTCTLHRDYNQLTRFLIGVR